MATMVMPFHAVDIPFGEVEDGVTFVSLGVKQADKLASVFRITWKLFSLTWALNQTLVQQEKLIDRLNGPTLQNLSSAQFIDLAERIEHLVGLNDVLLNGDPSKPWAKLLVQMRTQRDNLESIAESFRCAADFETDTLLSIALESVSV